MGIQPIRKQVMPEIPDKLYFRIGDVARICEVPAYVLRFWETEFPQLKPNKGGTGQRLYRKRDVEMALRIKSLLYDQGYTIPGARQVFKAEAKAREAAELAEALPVPADTRGSEAEAAAPATLAVSAPAPSVADADGGEAIRAKAALRALRDEMRALLLDLERPLGQVSAKSAEQAKAEPAKGAPAKLHALRPRLVLETRPKPAETLRLVLDAGVADPRAQGDLFAGE